MNAVHLSEKEVNMKTHGMLLVGILMTLFLLPGLTSSGRAADAVLVGVMHWEGYPYSKMMRNSQEMAVETVNKSGGVNGRPLKLVYADDKGEREPGEKCVRDFKNRDVAMLIGGYGSSNTIYTARMADNMDLPFLVCTAADDRITQRKWKNVFRLNPPASQYTRGLEDFLLQKVNPRTMAIVYENSPYGTGSALRMMWFCRENDIEITVIVPYHKERTQPEYFERIIAPIRGNAPEVIYMVSYLKDAALLTKTIRTADIRSLLCGGAGGFTHQKFIEMAGETSAHVLTATLWSEQLEYAGVKSYFDQYAQRYSAPPDYHGAEGYSAVLVAADALSRAKSLDAENIRDALNDTDMTTPFGPVKFAAYGKFERQNSLPTMALQVVGNAFKTIWPPDLSKAEFIPPPYWRKFSS